MRLGDARTRTLYAVLVQVAALAMVLLAWNTTWWALLGVFYAAPVAPAARTVLEGARGRDLVRVLQQTGLGELLMGAGIFFGVLWSQRP